MSRGLVCRSGTAVRRQTGDTVLEGFVLRLDPKQSPAKATSPSRVLYGQMDNFRVRRHSARTSDCPRGLVDKLGDYRGVISSTAVSGDGLAIRCHHSALRARIVA